MTPNALINVFEVAARISGWWSLAAFGIAGIIFVLSRRQAKGRWIAVAAICLIVLMGGILAIAHLKQFAVYDVRVTVIDPGGAPVDDAHVQSSLGGEPKKVNAGWEFDIPASRIPSDGRLIIWASVTAAFLKGSKEIDLGADHNPTVLVQLSLDRTSSVKGIVTDRDGRGIVGASISIAGYERDGFVTRSGGNFVLPAHAATGQNVLLHAEAVGYAAVTQWHLAGEQPAVIVLSRK